MQKQAFIPSTAANLQRLPGAGSRAGFFMSALAAALGGLFLFAPTPVLQGWALWSLVAVGAAWVLSDAWRESREPAQAGTHKPG